MTALTIEALVRRSGATVKGAPHFFIPQIWDSEGMQVFTSGHCEGSWSDIYRSSGKAGRAYYLHYVHGRVSTRKTTYSWTLSLPLDAFSEQLTEQLGKKLVKAANCFASTRCGAIHESTSIRLLTGQERSCLELRGGAVGLRPCFHHKHLAPMNPFKWAEGDRLDMALTLPTPGDLLTIEPPTLTTSIIKRAVARDIR